MNIFLRWQSAVKMVSNIDRWTLAHSPFGLDDLRMIAKMRNVQMRNLWQRNPGKSAAVSGQGMARSIPVACDISYQMLASVQKLWRTFDIRSLFLRYFGKLWKTISYLFISTILYTMLLSFAYHSFDF